MKRQIKFVAYFYFIDWSHAINIGLNIMVHQPHIEIHVPFGFFRIGWTDGFASAPNARTFGYSPEF